MRISRHYVPDRTVQHCALDAVLFFGTILLSALVAADDGGPGLVQLLLPAVVFALVMTALNLAFGQYHQQRHRSLMRAFGRSSLVLLLGAPLAFVVFTLLAYGEIDLRNVDVASLVPLIALVLAVQSLRAVRDRRIGTRRVLIVGVGAEAQLVANTLATQRDSAIEIVGFYPGVREPSAVVDRARILPMSASLVDTARDQGVSEIIVAVRQQRRAMLPLRELLDCRARGIVITDLLAFHERVCGEVPPDLLKASWLIYGEGFARSRWGLGIKRAHDLTATLLLMPLAVPLGLLAALAIRIESPGPVLVRQPRVGRGGRPFMLWTLRCRTHREIGEEATLPARLTRAGRLVRNLRLDELPQLINVLQGDMSLVGPRPESPDVVARLKERQRFYNVRHCIKPGITCWARVRQGGGGSAEAALRRLPLDLYYVKNHCLFLDVLILLETVHVMLFRDAGAARVTPAGKSVR